ncbi:hypothetical protein [Brevundimonas sp. TWP2-3-4b1]|uniref:hypothetical protein n=1 Tax=Brevundimonas sp. TWP2-3-4b1 TaxID=2804580 RepID=UPI003CF4E417
MGLFLITYDLCQPGRNYDNLYALLRDSWKASKIAESVWLAELKGPAPNVRDFIVRSVDTNDRVAVIELRQPFDWAAHHGLTGGVELLKKYSPSAR